MLSHIATTEADVLSALRALLLDRLPDTDVIRAQVNRVPEPANADFCVLTPLLRQRLSTNINAVADIILTGSITATELTVTAIAGGALLTGASLYAKTGLASGSTITAFRSGAGGTGTYTVAPSQSFPAGTLYAGQHGMMMPTQLTFQCDVHGPGSAENAQRIGTMIRSEFACDFFRARDIPVQPLHADDPMRQSAFSNAEAQYEDRWTVDVVLQANLVMTVDQQFADEVIVPVVPSIDLYLRRQPATAHFATGFALTADGV